MTPQGAAAATGSCLVRKSSLPSSGAQLLLLQVLPVLCYQWVLPGSSLPALRPQGLLLSKSLNLNHEFLLSFCFFVCFALLKHTNSLMLHPCSRNMLQFCLPKLPFGKRSHPFSTSHGKKALTGFFCQSCTCKTCCVT